MHFDRVDIICDYLCRILRMMMLLMVVMNIIPLSLSPSLYTYIYTSQTTLVQSKPLTSSPQTIIHDTSWSRDLIFSGDPLNESFCPDYSRLIVETHSSVGSSCIETSRNDWLLFHVLGCVKLVDLNDRVNNTLGMMTFNSLLNVLS